MRFFARKLSRTLTPGRKWPKSWVAAVFCIGQADCHAPSSCLDQFLCSVITLRHLHLPGWSLVLRGGASFRGSAPCTAPKTAMQVSSNCSSSCWIILSEFGINYRSYFTCSRGYYIRAVTPFQPPAPVLVLQFQLNENINHTRVIRFSMLIKNEINSCVVNW